MRTDLRAVDSAPPLPWMPVQSPLFMRIPEAGEVGDVWRLQERRRSIERLLEGRADSPQGWVHHDPGSRPPKSGGEHVRLPTQPRGGGKPGALTCTPGVRPTTRTALRPATGTRTGNV